MAITSIPGLLKTLYSPDEIIAQTLEDQTLLGVIPKDEKLGGAFFENMFIYGGSASGSADFGTAVLNGNAPPVVTPQIPPGQDYCVLSISNKLMKLSENGGKNAFMSALDLNMKGALAELGLSLSTTLVGDGTGKRGIVSANSSLGAAAPSVTLSDPEQVVNFQSGMFVQFAYQFGSTWGLRAGQSMVMSLDETDGILGFTSALPAGVAAGDIIIRAGDLASGTPYNNGLGTTGGTLFAGFLGWIPPLKPMPGTGDAWGVNNIDRSASTSRLAGVRVDARNMQPIDGLRLLADRIERQGPDPDYLGLNHYMYGRVCATINGQMEFETVESFDSPQIRYKVLVLPIGGRKIKIVKMRSLPSNVGVALNLKTWCLRSAGPLLGGLLDMPLYGDAVAMVGNSDAVQLRWGIYPLLSNSAPGHNGVVRFS